MPFIGSGQFQRIVGPYQGATLWEDQSIAEQAGGNLGPINPAYFDIQDQDFANGLSNCFTRDGQSTPTTDLPMDGKKFTNVGNATAGDQFAVVSQLQSGVYTYGGVASGTANALVLSVYPAITSYTNGMRIGFKASAANTGTVTVNINGVGIVPIRNWQDATVALQAGELLINGSYELIYNATVSAFQLYDRLVKPDNAVYFGVATGTANAIIVTVPPPFPALQDGLRVSFRATATNTSNTVTVNVNGTGAIQLKQWNTLLFGPSIGEFQVGGTYELIYNYNGGLPNWQLFNVPSGVAGATWDPKPLSASDSVTITWGSTTISSYKRLPGGIVELWLQMSFSLSAPCNRISFTLPFTVNPSLGGGLIGSAVRSSPTGYWISAALILAGTLGDVTIGVPSDIGLAAGSEKWKIGGHSVLVHARYLIA